MKLARANIFAAALFAALAFLVAAAAGEDAVNARLALMVEVDGAIGPATARQIKEALTTAGERHGSVVILRLNTPGGLVTSMREIIADILASQIPVIGYVAPSGAHAASAGTYILYATHIAAMAPGTNIGAATPVELGGSTPSPGGDGKDDSPPSKNAVTEKMTNDAVAFIRSLAQLRGRNAEWAEKAVREAASLSADDALKVGAINLIASNATELLERADGRVIELPGGVKRQIATKGLKLETLDPGPVIRLLSVITDPTVATVLMLLGIYGLIFEFSSPGAVAPGVIGTICLLIGFYAINLLPIDYTGLALMLLGIGFLVVEAFNPTVVLGIGGLIAFLLGAAMAFRVQPPGYQLSWIVLAAAAAVIFGLTLLSGTYLWSARRKPARIGASAMRGASAIVLDWHNDAGHVLIDGERWQARGEPALAPGETVQVTDIDGLTLEVRRAPAKPPKQGDAP